MALVLNDRVKETTTTTGTGTVNLAGAETGFETFVAGIGNTNTTYYAIVHQSADEFEVGLGTVSDSSPDTLSRTTIISSSNSDSAVNFSAGTKDVFCTLPASKAVFVDGSGDLEFNAPGDEFSFKNSSNTIAFIKTDNNDFTIQNNLNDKDFILKGYDADGDGLITGLTIDYSDAGKATFGGDVALAGNTISNASGDLTLDVVGSINLDADNNAEVSFRDAGTEIGKVFNSSSNFAFEAGVQDKDILFRGNDGGGAITALTLDMSESGQANFNKNGVFGGITVDPLSLTFTGTGVAINEDSGTAFMQIDGGNSARVEFGQSGTRNFSIYSDATNYSEFKRTTNHPILFGTNGTERMRLLGGGGLQLAAGNNISNASGDFTLDVAGDIILDADGENIKFLDGGTERGQIDLGSANFTLRASTSDKDMIFRVNDGGTEIVALTIDASEAGAATFNDNVTAYSDERLKDNIETIENGLDKVEQLRGVTYTRDEKESIGVIAQEVEKILPEIVLTADDEMGTKSVDYGRLTAVLIEAVKDLSARVKELEGK